VLDMFKHSGTHIAVVLDEYGDVQGLITMSDMLNNIVGEIDHNDIPISATLSSDDCCWLLDGFLPIDKLKEMLDIKRLPNEESKMYHTLAGFVLNELGHVPVVSEQVEYEGLLFVVTCMKGKRIDRIGVARLPATGDEEQTAKASAVTADR
jgi:putative hemolysin